MHCKSVDRNERESFLSVQENIDEGRIVFRTWRQEFKSMESKTKRKKDQINLYMGRIDNF